MAHNRSSVCKFNPADVVKFPYQYRDLNGALITSGNLTHVGGGRSVCVFHTSACGTTGLAFRCCTPTRNVDAASNVLFYPLIGLAIVLVGRMVYNRCFRKETLVSWSSILSGGKKLGCKGVLMMGLFALAVMAMVIQAVTLPQSIQQTLSPTDRAAQLAMEAFLLPMEKIFAFLEDTMVVKVGYAVICGRNQELNVLLHVSVLGGLFFGVLAFLTMLAVAMNKSSAEVILNPSSSSNQALIAAGCGLIPTSDELLDSARIYWLLTAAAWIPSFVTRGLSGFFVGTRELSAYLFPIIIIGVVPVALWFGLRAKMSAQLMATGHSPLNPLLILGISHGLAAWLVAAGFFIYFQKNARLRSKFNLYCLLCRRGGTRQLEFRALFVGVKRLMLDGLRLMVVDLAVQLSLTISIYVAAWQHFYLAYKLAAAQTAYFHFGPQYLIPVFLLLKMVGAQRIAGQQYRSYVDIFVFTGCMTFAVAAVAIATAAYFRVGVAYRNGSSACAYASNTQCAGAFADIFQGPDSLATLFDAFGATVALQMIFELLRSGLMSCHDFAFLAKSSSAVFVLVFIPAIIIARFVFNTALSYYVAMYLPHFVMILVFGWRMISHLRTMWYGGTGPWTEHVKKDIIEVEARQSIDMMSTHPMNDRSPRYGEVTPALESVEEPSGSECVLNLDQLRASEEPSGSERALNLDQLRASEDTPELPR